MTAIYDIDNLYKLKDDETLESLVPVELYYQNGKDIFNYPVNSWQDVICAIVQYCTKGWLNRRAGKFNEFIKKGQIKCGRTSKDAASVVSRSLLSNDYKSIGEGWYFNTKCGIRWIVVFIVNAMRACDLECRDLLIRCTNCIDKRESLLDGGNLRELSKSDKIKLSDEFKSLLNKVIGEEFDEFFGMGDTRSKRMVDFSFEMLGDYYKQIIDSFNSRLFGDDTKTSELIAKTQECETAQADLIAKTQECESAQAKLVAKTQECESAQAKLIAKTHECESAQAKLIAKTQECESAQAKLVAETQECKLAQTKLVAKTQECKSAQAKLVAKTQECESAQAKLVAETQECKLAQTKLVAKTQECESAQAKLVAKTQECESVQNELHALNLKYIATQEEILKNHEMHDKNDEVVETMISAKPNIFDLAQLCEMDGLDNLDPVKLLWCDYPEIKDWIFEGWTGVCAVIFSLLQKNKYAAFKQCRKYDEVYWDNDAIHLGDIILDEVPENTDDEYLVIPNTRLVFNASYRTEILIMALEDVVRGCGLDPEDLWIKCEMVDDDVEVDEDNINEDDEINDDELNNEADDDDDEDDEDDEDDDIDDDDEDDDIDDDDEDDDIDDDDEDDDEDDDIDDDDEDEYVDIDDEEEDAHAENEQAYSPQQSDEQFRTGARTYHAESEQEFDAEAIIIPADIGDAPYIVLNGSDDYSNMTGRKPIAFYYKGEKVLESTQWKVIYQKFFELLQNDYPDYFENPKNLKAILYPNAEFRNGYVGARSARMINKTNYCIVVGKDTNTLLKDMQRVIGEWELDGGDFVISYKDANSKQVQNSWHDSNHVSITERKYQNESPQTVRIRRRSVEEPASEVHAVTVSDDDSKTSLAPSPESPEQAKARAHAQELEWYREALNTDNASIEKYETTQLDNRYDRLLQIARQKRNWNAFVILYIIQNGAQTQRQLLDAYDIDMDTESENRCRSILYWWSGNFDWFVKSGERGNYIFDIPVVPKCLSNHYVETIIEKLTGSKAVSNNVRYYGNNHENVTVNLNSPLPDPPSLEPSDDEEGRIVDILRDYFAEGYGGGPKQQYRFAQRFEERYYRKCRLEGDGLDATIVRLTWQIDEKGYRPETILSDENDDRLMETIDRMFSNGAPYIEYQALMDSQDEAGDSYLLPIKTADDLCTYLRYIHADYTYFPQKLANDKTLASVNITEQITEFVLNRGDWVSLEDLRCEFPYLSRNTITTNMDNDVMLENAKDNTWIHIDNIGLDESDYETMGDCIAEGLRESAPLNYPSLFERLPDLIADVLQNLPKDVMRSLLAMKYGDQYAFKAVINYVGASSSLDTALENEFGHQERITMSDIEDLMKRMGTQAYSTVFTYIYNNFCRISESDFVKAESISFDVPAIDRQIAAQHKGDYILMRDIIFDGFPYAGYQWNKYLLYSYIYRYSERYELRNAVNFPVKRGEGGLAAHKANHKQYDEYLFDYLSKQNKRYKTDEDIVDVLFESILIYFRKYKNSASLLNKLSASENA